MATGTRIGTVTLHGGPAHGREITMADDIFRFGRVKVIVELETAAWLDDPFEIKTVSPRIAVYERSLRNPSRWNFLRMEGERK